MGDGCKVKNLPGVYVQENGIIRKKDGRYIGRLDDITFEEIEQSCPSTQGMNFGSALEAMKEGKKVGRAGWNGKSQWVVMMPSLYLPPHSTQEPGAMVNDRTAKHIGVDTPLDSQPYCALFNAQGKWQPGWVPSQGDLFAEDWGIL